MNFDASVGSAGAVGATTVGLVTDTVNDAVAFGTPAFTHVMP